MPCFMLISTSFHAYMFRSTCLGFYAMFPLFRSSLCFVLMLGLCAHMLHIMSMVMLCSNLCVCMPFATFYAQICIRTCLYAWIRVLPCLCASFHMPTRVAMPMPRSMFMYLDLCFHVLVCSDLRSACFMPSSMCLCVPCHVCVPRPRLCLSCHVLFQPFCCFTFLSYVLAYWFGPNPDPMVFVIARTHWPTSKGLDHPYLHVYACLLLCFMFVLSSLVLGSATFDTLSGFVVM